MSYVCQQLDDFGQCVQWQELTDKVWESVPPEMMNEAFLWGAGTVLLLWFAGFAVGVVLKLIQ